MNYSLKLFNWHQNTKTLTTEISTLNTERLNRVINIVSHHTGKVKTFNFSKIKKDDEDDILFWEYCPSDPSDCKSKVKKLIIFND